MKQTPVASAVRSLTRMADGTYHDLNAAPLKPSRVLQSWKAQHGPATLRARHVGGSKRSYAAASFGRTAADWIAQSTSADAELFTSLRTLRNRSRQLVRDNEYAAHAIKRVLPNNIVGQGVRFQAQVMMRRGKSLNQKINTAIEGKWERWKRAEFCHTAGRLAFEDIERMVMACVPESGELLVRMICKSFGGSKVPFALEVIEADQLVDNFSGRTNEGREIRMGVEVDEWQRPVAYWLYPRHPGDYTIASTAPSNTWQRVPADEVIHIALFDRPMQTRGVPWLHAAMTKLRHTGGFEEALIVKARASASIMGFIQSDSQDTGVPGTGDDPMGADDVVDGEKVYDMAPGVIKELAPGETFNGFAPNGIDAAVEPFIRFLIRSFAVGTGISYESVSRDYSQSNYSSSRLALTEDRDHYRVLQAWLIRRFHQRVFEKWLEMAVLAGELDLPGYENDPEIYQAVRWSPRGWDWIDPVKEVAAYRAAVRAGFMATDDVIAAKGGDAEETFKRMKRDNDLAKEYGLVLDTDPSQTNDKGALQGDAAPAPEPGGADSSGDQTSASSDDGEGGQQQE
jgi:lambda family phage portal protein